MKRIEVFRDQLKSIAIKEPGEYLVILKEAGAEVDIRGAFKIDQKNKIEVSVVIHHQAPNTRANTTLRGVAGDSAHISLKGKIIIDHACGNSNSFLTERVLLLSNQAHAECVPDLEIHTYDVKCSHAASITRIPEAHLFYLMSRGLSRSEAEKLIVEGFLS